MLTKKLHRERVKLNHMPVRFYWMRIFLLSSRLLACFWRNYWVLEKALMTGRPDSVSLKKLKIGLLLIDSNLYRSRLACM